MGTIDINTINPYIRVAMHSVLPAGTEIKKRAIFDYELIYIEKGNFIFNYAGTDHRCKAGQFILIRPGVSHSFGGITHNLYQPHIHFDVVCTTDSPNIPVSYKDIEFFTREEHWLVQPDIFSDYPLSPFVTFSDTALVLDLFYKTIDLNRNGSPLAAKGLLTLIIDTIIRDNFPDCLSKNMEDACSIAHHVKSFIDSGQGINCQLASLEKQFSYNRFHLEKVFKKEFGVSLIAYRNNKRMQLACKMLTDRTISGVSEELGFSSIYSFSRAFKNKYGVCPSEYKNTMIKEKENE